MKELVISILILMFANVGMAAVSPSEIIGHWKMNDDAATATVVDETGNHDGTYKNASGNLNTDTGASTGRIGGAIDCNGTSDYIKITDHADFTPALTPFSVAVTVYMHDATDFIIASKGDYNTDGEWWLKVDGNEKFNFVCMDESVDSCRIGRIYDTAMTSFENQWIHLVATYDGGTVSSGIKLYLNGKRIDDTDLETNAGSFVAIENLNHSIWIGRYSLNYADGLIDNVMFFDHELSQYDVDILYTNSYGTETITDLDSKLSPRRCNASNMPLRRRYEF